MNETLTPGSGEKKNAILRTILPLASALIAVLIMDSRHAPAGPTAPHNCRMWGITTSSMYYGLEVKVRAQLDSLRNLGNANYNGWGMSFFAHTDPDTVMPVFERGEPMAPDDPRYGMAVDDMIMFMRNTAIAHVRRASSGPADIPDPHPFFRKSLHRNLNLVFAHNGSVSTKALLDLIRRENSAYIDSNPPDYPDPNYLDSDLYFLYLVEIMDTRLAESIEQCVRIAVMKIDSVLGPPDNVSQLNFLMTDGYTLWALRHAWEIPDYFSLYIYPPPDIIPSNFWIAASEPLDDKPGWSLIPNSCLVTLRPGAMPQYTYIYNPPACSLTVPIASAFALRQNPSNRGIVLTYDIAAQSPVRITVHDITGIRVRTIVHELQAAGFHNVTWDGRDDRGKEAPAGSYFISLEQSGRFMTRKAVLLP